MAKARKDNKGRVLRTGECQRASDLMYIYTYMDAEGKRRYVYAKNLADLREKEEELLKNRICGIDSYRTVSTDLNMVFDRYMASKTELRRTSYNHYLYLYDHFVREGFGRKKMSDIKYSDVLLFYYHLLKDKEIQPASLKLIHAILHPVFRLAVRDGIIRANPTDGCLEEVRRKTGKKQSRRHALTQEQQRIFMHYVTGNPEFCSWGPMFTVMLGTGCRIGEIIGLRWEDIDSERRLISINHSVSYCLDKERKRYKFSVFSPKTEAGIRTIPMMDAVYRAFMEQKENGPESTAEIEGMKGFIFCNPVTGSIHTPSTVNRAIRRILDSYNINESQKAERENRQPVLLPHFSCHHLRHTFCTRFCEQTDDIKVIQAVMGHESIVTTMDIYNDVTEDRKMKAIESLSQNINIF